MTGRTYSVETIEYLLGTIHMDTETENRIRKWNHLSARVDAKIEIMVEMNTQMENQIGLGSLNPSLQTLLRGLYAIAHSSTMETIEKERDVVNIQQQDIAAAIEFEKIEIDHEQQD
mgnify:CR=1 FL=1|tara:strand:- start:120 stop:467 length:348 start_codon:yes stop_codon:yes gene_type:complete